MSDWQPMETAPKDGSFILIADIGRQSLSYTITRYRGGWANKVGYDGIPIAFDEGTRWQPLPLQVGEVREWLRGVERELATGRWWDEAA